MKRHPALQDLSRDHYQALILCKDAGKALAGNRDAPSVTEAAQGIVDRWEDELRLHFREEEDVLLPVLSRHEPVTSVEPVPRMIDDHAWFRDRIPRLAEALENGDEVEDLLEDVATRLREHARMEEDELFERAQEMLPEEDLEAVGERSEAFRERHRGPDAIGPDRPAPGSHD
jgi:iron-sulfur cluster repair protein YtfE (RIC family)